MCAIFLCSNLVILNQNVITWRSFENDSMLWWHMQDFSNHLVCRNPAHMSKANQQSVHVLRIRTGLIKVSASSETLSVLFWRLVVEFSKTVEITYCTFNSKQRERAVSSRQCWWSFSHASKCCFIQGKLKLVFFGSWCEVKWLTIVWFCSGTSWVVK